VADAGLADRLKSFGGTTSVTAAECRSDPVRPPSRRPPLCPRPTHAGASRRDRAWQAVFVLHSTSGLALRGPDPATCPYARGTLRPAGTPTWTHDGTVSDRTVTLTLARGRCARKRSRVEMPAPRLRPDRPLVGPPRLVSPA
jgi:hypothetical protein